MTTFKLDKVHSAIDFQIKHMMVSKTKGSFNEFDVDLQGDLSNLEAASVTVKIAAASIDTGNEDRDGHLISGDFFDAENYPNLVFKSKSIKKLSDEKYEVTGDFTIKDVTNTEVFTVEFNGTSKSPLDGSTATGFEVSSKINREDYGLTYNAPLETGGVLIGKEVKFEGDFEFIVED